jgi:hypothetical protein
MLDKTEGERFAAAEDAPPKGKRTFRAEAKANLIY